MAAPKFVPIAPIGAFREGGELPPADAWSSSRPAEITGRQPTGRAMGTPGPDQGYALKLAHRLSHSLKLTEGEHEHDVIAGCVGVALKRAALFGRAPIGPDLELAYAAFGFLTDSPAPELIGARKKLFEAAGHHYELQRAIADAVPEATLRMTPAQVRSQAAGTGWTTLLAASG